MFWAGPGHAFHAFSSPNLQLATVSTPVLMTWMPLARNRKEAQREVEGPEESKPKSKNCWSSWCVFLVCFDVYCGFGAGRSADRPLLPLHVFMPLGFFQYGHAKLSIDVPDLGTEEEKEVKGGNEKKLKNKIKRFFEAQSGNLHPRIPEARPGQNSDSLFSTVLDRSLATGLAVAFLSDFCLKKTSNTRLVSRLDDETIVAVV